MNRQFTQFLKNRPKPKNKNGCDHGKDIWCQNCIRRPELVSVELPDGTISTGYIITNHI